MWPTIQSFLWCICIPCFLLCASSCMLAILNTWWCFSLSVSCPTLTQTSLKSVTLLNLLKRYLKVVYLSISFQTVNLLHSTCWTCHKTKFRTWSRLQLLLLWSLTISSNLNKIHRVLKIHLMNLVNLMKSSTVHIEKSQKLVCSIWIYFFMKMKMTLLTKIIRSITEMFMSLWTGYVL